MYYKSCNYCGANDTQLLNHGPDLLLDLPGDFHLVRCQRCGLIYQNPQLSPEELIAHYPPDYLPYKQPAVQMNWIRQLSERHNLERRRRLLERFWPAPGCLLDVGCSTGLFLNTMRVHGWDVTGVEPSSYASKLAREQFGLNVYTGTLESLSLPAQIFDVITLWDVLEHVSNPRSTLQEIVRLLRPGGLLALSLPNPSSWEARIFGSYWVGWDRPRHMHLFSPKVITSYLNEYGFDSITMLSLGGRLGLTLMSLEFTCRAYHVPARTWQLGSRLIYTWPLRLFTWPFYRLLEYANLTTNMNVFAYHNREKSTCYEV